jgi:hypothetical protein
MDFRNLLQSLDQLDEATEKTKTGIKHTSEPGGYGRKVDASGDDENEPKKKRGGQEKDEGPKASKDTPKGDIFGRTSGEAPKGKKGTEYSKMKAGDKAEKAAEKAKKKSTLKDWFEQLDKEVMNEGGLSVQPIPAPKQQTGQNFMIKDPSNPQAAAITTSDPAVIDAAKKGTLSMHKPGASPTAASATPTTGAGSQVAPMQEEGENWIKGAIKHPGAFKAKAEKAGMSTAAFAKKHAHDSGKLGKQARLAQTLGKMHKESVEEAERPENFAQASPLSGSARNDMALESKKPDANKNGIPDYAEDGKGKNDLKKKKVKEGMNENLLAARLKGKHDGIKGHSHCGKTYEDMEEARCYHEGYKEGLDECYGQMPIQGYVGEMNNEVENMASYGARTPELDEMDKTAYMKQQAIKTPGNTFKAFGQTMQDDDVLGEFAFESLDKQLNALLEDKEDVAEGMTVSISKGQQGAPDSVSVSAQDGEADQLLSIIKSAGLGLFGGEDKGGYGAPEGGANAHGGISVVDDHDGMMALMKKLSGGDEASDGDYESEAGHDDECDACGASPCDCDEQIDEVESEDQMAYEVAEANAPDSGADNTNADVAGQVGNDSALATADAAEDEAEAKVYSSPVSEESEAEKDDHAERAGKKVAKDIEYDEGHKGKDDDKAERAGEKVKKDIEYDDKKDDKMSESSFFNLYKKLALLSEESTAEKDDKAEKAAKKVAKDIEYDEGHKGKDDNKAEKAGKKVKKDIEYDDKKDKKEKIDEWANEAGPGKTVSDTTFETDIDFMMNVISSGLNKRKSTGQTTIPVIGNQLNRSMSHNTMDISESKMLNESVNDWKKLAGIK